MTKDNISIYNDYWCEARKCGIMLDNFSTTNPFHFSSTLKTMIFSTDHKFVPPNWHSHIFTLLIIQNIMSPIFLAQWHYDLIQSQTVYVACHHRGLDAIHLLCTNLEATAAKLATTSSVEFHCLACSLFLVPCFSCFRRQNPAPLPLLSQENTDKHKQWFIWSKQT